MSLLYKKIISFFRGKRQQFLRLSLCHSLVHLKFLSANKSRLATVKHLFAFVGIIASVSFFTACEKVINIDLNSAEKKYVIEATVTDHDDSCNVLLSQTKNFSDDNSFNGISGAQITVADNNENPVALTETSPGVYQSALKGISGHTYNLTVNVAGHVFTATSKMPQLVPLDSVYTTSRSIFGKTNKYASVQYTDPLGEGNAYRFIQYVNRVKEKTIFVRDDDFSDGRTINRDLVFFNNGNNNDDGNKLKTGDKVRIEMLCIDYPIYKYWYSLTESSTGDSQSTSPANPVTNIQGGALGYFSAHTLQTRDLVIP